MITTATIQSLAQIGDRVEADTEKARIDGFLEKIDMEGIVVSWKYISIGLVNNKQQEVVLTTSIFIPNEEIRTLAVIK